MKKTERDGRPIPVWFRSDDIRRLEEAMALAGCTQMSGYIRDRVLNNDDPELSNRLHDLMEAQTETEHHMVRLEKMLSVLLAMTYRRATGTEQMRLIDMLENNPDGLLGDLQKFLR